MVKKFPQNRFLTEVETAVLEGDSCSPIEGGWGKLRRSARPRNRRFANALFILFGGTHTSSAELDAGEAIIFANGTHVELDGLRGLSSGSHPLVEKKKEQVPTA